MWQILQNQQQPINDTLYMKDKAANLRGKIHNKNIASTNIQWTKQLWLAYITLTYIILS